MISTNSQLRHLLSTKDLNKDYVIKLLDKAENYQDHFESGGGQIDELRGKLLATLFFEASTRTRLSFESAMVRLGGSITSIDGMQSSFKKGESLDDMGRILSGYADIVAMRHPTPYSVDQFAKTSDVSVINAGDGANEHPTQALLDLYTIRREKGCLSDLKIGFIGDLKYSRTVHSLISLLQYFNNELHFISDTKLRLPDEKLGELNSFNGHFFQHETLSDCIESLDVLYVTRLQEERFDDLDLFQHLSKTYRLTKESLKNSKSNLSILHPLPKVNEIDSSIDLDPRAKYFDQAKNGLYVRMALLSEMLS